MRLLFRLVALLAGLVVAAVAFVWLTVPINVPWRSLLQAAGVLPAWLDPVPVSADLVGNRLVGPTGYGVSLFATGVSEARGLSVTSAGDVLVSTPRDGEVVLLEADDDGDGVSDGRRVLLDALTRPNGLDVHGGYLYVAEEDGIGRAAFDQRSGTITGDYQRIIDRLPPGGNHWRKTIRFGPDGLLYLTIGSSCNVCVEEDPRRAAMLRFTADGQFVDIFATGLRNSAGFDWSPTSGRLYATDNGRDLLGDNFPPCELNEVVEGGFYGWPLANGARVPDPDLGEGRQTAIDQSIAPVHDFRPHNAPLGIVFLRETRHAPAYRDAAIVALHGSWNRAEKDGYKVVSLHFDPDGAIEERDFLTGFLSEDTAIGRPADVAEGPDGSVYVSDDFGSAVYRVAYGAVDSGAVSTPIVARREGYDLTAISTEERDAALAAGGPVFESAGCGECHAPSDAGRPAQVVLEDLASRYTVDELAEFLMAPQPPMPPYEGDPEQRRVLAVYLLESY